MAIGCLLAFIVPFDRTITVAGDKVINFLGFPAYWCGWKSTHPWSIAYLQHTSTIDIVDFHLAIRTTHCRYSLFLVDLNAKDLSPYISKEVD